MHRFWCASLALLSCLCLSLPPVVSAQSRATTPKVVAPLASSLGQGLPTEHTPLSEGQHFINSLSKAEQELLLAKNSVLLPEDKSEGENMAGYIKAVVIFEQNKERTLELMMQPSKQVLYLPRLTQAINQKHTPEGELTEFHLAAGPATVKFWTQHWWWQSHSRLEWALEPSKDNDINVAEGFWQLYALDEKRCVGEYGTLVDTGLPIPTMVQSYLARKDIPEALDGMQSYINSDGRYRREE